MKKAMLVAWHNSSSESIAPLFDRMRGEIDWRPTLVGYHPAITGPDRREGVFDKRRFPYVKIADEPNGVTLERIEKIIDQIGPNIVVGGSSHPGSRGIPIAPEQLAFEAARKRGIPSLSVMDYWLVQNRYDGPGTDERLKYLPNKIAALNEEHSKREMVEQGIPEEIIVPTGNPQHDHLHTLKARWSPEKTSVARQEIGVPEGQRDKYLVALFSSVRDDMLDRDRDGYWDVQVIDSVMRGIKALPEDRKSKIFLVMKNHPGEKPLVLDVFASLVNSYSAPKSEGGYGLPVAFLDSRKYKLNMHPDEMPLAVDLSIAPRSNLLIAGTLMNRDCISLQPGRNFETGGPDPLITNMLNLTPHTYTIKDSIELITSAVASPDSFFGPYRERRKNSGFNVDGKRRKE